AHIHLANVNNPFPPQLRQFSRTNDEAHLVYCQGAFDEQAWLLKIARLIISYLYVIHNINSKTHAKRFCHFSNFMHLVVISSQ
ncbi:type II toxin-antitoxin system YafO family toxin, partial [Escherichia coli]|uniref:type II toxin-antitoxin system YafO family toxin n=1 Tax=Escherichia coli TaxID=562 RepID=UPI003EE22C2F